MKLKNTGAGAMATVKNEVFIGLLHENFYLVGGNEPLVREKIVPGAAVLKEQIFGS